MAEIFNFAARHLNLKTSIPFKTLANPRCEHSFEDTLLKSQKSTVEYNFIFTQPIMAGVYLCHNMYNLNYKHFYNPLSK